MKPFMLSFFLICNCICIICYSQESEFVEELIRNASKTERDKWNINLTNIITKSNAVDVYERLTNEINKKITHANSLNQIAKYINPSDKSLTGKSYNEFIGERAEFYFVKNGGKPQGQLDAENAKRVQGVLANLTDESLNDESNVSVIGGIVKGFISSTPVLNVATKVITGISTFFKSTKAGNRITDISQTIKKEKLQEFKNDLKPYIEFYDGALKLNMEFGNEIEESLELAQSLDAESKNATIKLKEYVRSITGKEVFTYDDMEAKFPFDFEKLYFKTYDIQYYDLLKLVDNIEAIYLESNVVSEKADKAINRYLKSMKDLVEKFNGKIKKNESSNVDLTLINSEIDEYKQDNTVSVTKFGATESYRFIDIDYESDIRGDYEGITFVNIRNENSAKALSGPNLMPIGFLVLIVLGLIGFYFTNRRIRNLKRNAM